MVKKKNKKRSLEHKEIHLAYRDPKHGGIKRLEQMLRDGEISRMAIRRLHKELKATAGAEKELVAWAEANMREPRAPGVQPPKIGETRPYQPVSHGSRRKPILRLPLYHIDDVTTESTMNVTYFHNKIVVVPA